ncbi:MAG TPA: single-stranded DNA-binding protein [Thermotogota bacterium]|nr:single-stranded DNA-binding protein [Thermotogota bacterium]HPJ87533.1 single-stranded DNA-binding protein [Thermotogota bacterium]HPR94738.1 single-stranded DNA-binding protein [Thermotogota bacterium]
MAISYNKAILVGRLTADPQVSYSSNGLMIAKFTLAVDRQFRKDNQQGGQETDFLRIVVFGKQAEFASNYLAKGRLVMIEGRIQVSRYQAQDGTARYSTDIIAETIRFMETKRSSEDFDRRSGGMNDFSNKPFDNEEIVTNTDDVFDGPGESGDDEVPF